MDNHELKKYLPKPEICYPYVYELIKNYDVNIVINRDRLTKHGDFRPSQRAITTHRITINSGLNKPSFLLTLIHEVAHLLVWEKHKKIKNIKPHGAEWKNMFQKITLPLVQKNLGVFDSEIIPLIITHLNKPKSSISFDAELMHALMKYDGDYDPNISLLKHLDTGQKFIFRNRHFIKKESKRSRSTCLDLQNEGLYYIHNSAKIRIVEN